MEPDTLAAWMVVVFVVTVILCFLVVWVWYRSTITNLFWQLAGDAQAVCEELEEAGGIPEYKRRLPPLTDGKCGKREYNKELAQALLEIDLNVTLANCECVLPLPTPPDFRYQRRIEGADPYNGEEHMFAYIFWSGKGEPALISFTGTHYASEWADNFNYSLTPWELSSSPSPAGCQELEVHRGFYQIYLAIREQLWQWLNAHKEIGQLYISGHSLGGALSTLCAFDLVEKGYPDLIQYSFASPRVGEQGLFQPIQQETLR